MAFAGGFHGSPLGLEHSICVTLCKLPRRVKGIWHLLATSFLKTVIIKECTPLTVIRMSIDELETEAISDPSRFLSAPQTIEFFGLPGVGKTTVAHHVVAGLRRAGWPILASHEVIGDDLTSAKRHGARVGLLLSEFPNVLARRATIGRFSSAGSQSLKGRTKALYNTLTLTAFEQKAVRKRKTLILDQGMAQAAWSVLNFSTGAISEANPILPAKNWSPVIIALSAPLDTVVDRIRTRRSRHSRMQNDKADWLRAKNAETAVLNALESRSDAGQMVVNHYRADQIDPSVLADRIVEDLLEFQAQQSAVRGLHLA